jgi:oxygen-dependent protoporphyrinogen oxidase
MTPSRRIVVVGGGIAGLAAANRLLELRGNAASPAVVLLEATPRLGGVVGSGDLGGAVVDGGGDMFITDKPWGLALAERLGLGERLVAPDARYRRALVLRRGRPYPVPEGFMLLAPSAAWPILTTPILSPLGKLRVALELVLPRGNPARDESLGAFVRRRFGGELLERLVQPLVGGIYGGDPELLSLRATLPRFVDMEQRGRSLSLEALRQGAKARGAAASGARYGLFVGLRGGMQELVDALARRVTSGAEVRLGSRVRSIAARPHGGYDLELDERESLACDALIVATPAHTMSSLVAPLSTRLAERLGQIPASSMAVVVTLHRANDVAHPLDASGLVVPHVEKRDVIAVSFASRKLPGRAPEGWVQLRTFVGGELRPELFAKSDDELVHIVRRELASMLGVRDRPDDPVLVMRHPRSMPQYRVGHLSLVAAVEAELERHPRLALAGNAFRGVGIPDTVHSGEEAAERLWKVLDTNVLPRSDGRVSVRL